MPRPAHRTGTDRTRPVPAALRWSPPDRYQRV